MYNIKMWTFLTQIISILEYYIHSHKLFCVLRRNNDTESTIWKEKKTTLDNQYIHAMAAFE